MTVVQESDLSLVNRAREGDAAAFSALYLRHQGLVQRVVARYVINDDAPDLCQDAFTKAWERLPRARPDTTFAPWVAQIAARTALDYVRSAHAKLMRTGGLPNEDPHRGLLAAKLQHRPALEQDPEERTLAQEQAALMAELLHPLRDWEREAIHLTAAGYGLREIARHQVKPPTSLKPALFRVRADLAMKIVADQERYGPLDIERADRSLGSKLSAFVPRNRPPEAGPPLSEGDSH